MDDIGFGWLGIYGLLFKTLAFMVAALSVMTFSIYLDRRLGIPFKDAIRASMERGDHSWYYAARWVGLAILGASIYG